MVVYLSLNRMKANKDHAGLSWKVTKNLLVDLCKRWHDLYSSQVKMKYLFHTLSRIRVSGLKFCGIQFLSKV